MTPFPDWAAESGLADGMPRPTPPSMVTWAARRSYVANRRARSRHWASMPSCVTWAKPGQVGRAREMCRIQRRLLDVAPPQACAWAAFECTHVCFAMPPCFGPPCFCAHDLDRCVDIERFPNQHYRQNKVRKEESEEAAERTRYVLILPCGAADACCSAAEGVGMDP